MRARWFFGALSAAVTGFLLVGGVVRYPDPHWFFAAFGAAVTGFLLSLILLGG